MAYLFASGGKKKNLGRIQGNKKKTTKLYKDYARPDNPDRCIRLIGRRRNREKELERLNKTHTKQFKQTHKNKKKTQKQRQSQRKREEGNKQADRNVMNQINSNTKR